jgi:hypothetical protein
MDSRASQSRREAIVLAAAAVIALPVAFFTVGVPSWVGAVAMLPLIRRATRAIRPPRFPWPAAPLAHLPAAMLFACGQLLIAAACRKLFELPQPPSPMLEVRSGLLFYAFVVGALLWAGSHSAPTQRP